MQHRHKSELTATEYVTRKAWCDATPPACLKPSARDKCGIHRHGTYGRKTPHGMRIQRWWCRQCQTTFSALPDCLASHHRGTLADFETQVAMVELQGTLVAAVRALIPQCINPETTRRLLSRRVKRVYRALRTCRGLSAALFGATPTIVGFRVHLNTQSVLYELRELCSEHLAQLPAPLGFRPVNRGSGSQRGPPTLD